MRIARFSVSDEVSFGVVEGDEDDDLVLAQLATHPFGPIQLTGVRHRLADVRLLAPMLPSKVIGVGRNYAEHAAEMGDEVPPEPILFIKPSTSVIGPDDAIVYPHQSADLQHEAELAVVIGRLCRDVPVERAEDVVFGYTCANDVTARDLQRSDVTWMRGKGFDTFCPLGPWVRTDIDPADLAVTCTVGDELRQAGRTRAMIYPVAALIAHVSSVVTLLPGDVILTGTPAGVGPLSVGDEVSVSVEGIGTLRNRVVKRG